MREGKEGRGGVGRRARKGMEGGGRWTGKGGEGAGGGEGEAPAILPLESLQDSAAFQLNTYVLLLVLRH